MSDNPDQLCQEGKSAFQDEDYSRAAQLFKDALTEYAAQNKPLLAAEMANNLSVAFLKGGDPKAALLAVEGTDSIFAGAGVIQKQAMALANKAAALEGLKKWAQALELYEQSSDLLKQIGEKELRAYVLKCISGIQLRQGKQLEAVASMDASLDNKPNPGPVDRIVKRLIRWVYGLLGR